jgi:hypothetical protein
MELDAVRQGTAAQPCLPVWEPSKTLAREIDRHAVL